MDYEKARLDKSVAEASYNSLKKRVEPYLLATEGLNREEIIRLNEAMQIESCRIAVESEKFKIAIHV